MSRLDKPAACATVPVQVLEDKFTWAISSVPAAVAAERERCAVLCEAYAEHCAGDELGKDLGDSAATAEAAFKRAAELVREGYVPQAMVTK